MNLSPPRLPLITSLPNPMNFPLSSSCLLFLSLAQGPPRLVFSHHSENSSLLFISAIFTWMLNIGSSSSIHLYSPTIRVVVAISMALTISHEQMTEISSEPQNHLPSLKDNSHAKLSMWYVRAQSCPTLCNSMDCSLPGSSVHGNLQARILGWVAISYFRGSLNLCLLHWVTGEAPKFSIFPTKYVLLQQGDPFLQAAHLIMGNTLLPVSKARNTRNIFVLFPLPQYLVRHRRWSPCFWSFTSSTHPSHCERLLPKMPFLIHFKKFNCSL